MGQDDGVAWLEPEGGGSPSSGRLAAVEKPVRHVVQTSADRLWVSTELGDLLRVDLEADGVTGTVRPYGPDDGLPGTVAHPLMLGDDLLVAARGFFRYDPARDRFELDPRFPETFAGAHGLALCPLADGTLVASADHRTLHLVPGEAAFEQPGSVVERVPLGNRLISCLAEDSIVWLGTDDGLFRWDREAETQSGDHAAVQLRSIALGGLGVLAADLGAGAMSVPPIPWRSAPLRVEFSLPSLVAAERNEYRTLLEGFESEWTPWTRLGWRELTVLPPGRYRLRVEARNVRREPARAATLDFKITPPWYRSGVAYAGYGLLAVAGLAGVGRLQVSQVRRRNLELQRTVEDRTEELRAASITDPLTGLHNRRFFAEIIDAEIAAAARAQRRFPGDAQELLFCIVDLDHFKSVNDALGHAGGDDFLVQTAERLRAIKREGDLLFRWGGEELLLMARNTRREGGAELARRLLQAIGGVPMTVRTDHLVPSAHRSRQPWRLTCSVGFAPMPLFADAARGASLDEVLRFADAALYQAKRTGRNRACGVLPSLPYDVVRDTWDDWQRQSVAEASTRWLSLVIVEGPKATA